MNIVLDSAFERLLSKYEQAFGEPPPFKSAPADEVVGYMRRRLRDAVRTEMPPGPPAAAESGSATLH